MLSSFFFFLSLSLIFFSYSWIKLCLLYLYFTEASVNESCFFNEQCEAFNFQTECRDGRCICRFEMSPIVNKDGTIECKGMNKVLTFSGCLRASWKSLKIYVKMLKWFPFQLKTCTQSRESLVSPRDTSILPWLGFLLVWR